MCLPVFCSYSDLLVGAPYHSHSEYGDEGRVYVYINNGKVPVELTLYSDKCLDLA